jgi:branched-chain amino acid transport system substrate-binding protein
MRRPCPVRRWRTALSLGVAAVLVGVLVYPLLAGPAARVGAPYRIGFIASVTGPGASLGIPERDVARLVQERLNREGGIVGPDGVRHEVEILIHDDQSRADVAASLARRLIEHDQVHVLVGTTLSGPSLAIVPIATELRTPNISMASARAIIEDPATKRMRTWIFKPVPENLHSAAKQAEYLKAVGIDRVCHLYENTAYGHDTFASAKQEFPKLGIRILYGDSFDRFATEFPQVTRVRASGCQAVVIGSIPPAAGVINVAVAGRVGPRKIVHGHGACSPDLIRTAGQAAEGTVMPCGKILVADQLPVNDPVRRVNLQLIEEYSRFTGGQPISTFAGHAYDALQWALLGLQAVPDGQPLARVRELARDGIERIRNYVGTHGVMNLSPEDHLGFDPKDFVIVTVRGGRFVLLPPKQWK